jgi:hypothetical protein
MRWRAARQFGRGPLAWGLGIGTAMLMAACSSQTHGASPSATASAAPAPTYAVQVAVSGRDGITGSFVVRPVIAGGVTTCLVPTVLSGTVSGHHFVLELGASRAALGQPHGLAGGDVTLTTDADVWIVNPSAPASPSSGTLQRDADGGGSVTFRNLHLQSVRSRAPLESGSVHWSCR